MIKFIVKLFIFLTIPFLSYAEDQYIFEQSSSPTNSIFDSQITINKTFTNINSVITKLNSLGIKATIKNYNQNELQNVLIKSNGTVNDFITAAAPKFNYSINESGSTILLTALNPKLSSLISAKSVGKAITLQPTWILDPKNKTLRSSLSQWCKKANWQLVWNVRADYPITTTWSIAGTFENAVNEVLKASQKTDMPLVATMHDSNHVLEISSPSNTK
jgi:hypothetical protein